MTSFGRKSTTRVGIPNNRLLTKRANVQLEGYAHAKAEHFTNSLGVDAPLFYFWHKENGSVPCSCIAARTSANRDVNIGGENSTLNVHDRKQDFNIKIPKYGEKTNSEVYGKEDFKAKQASSKDKFFINDYDDPLSGTDDSINDIEDLADGIGDNGITGFDDPLNLFGSKLTYCPVCFGSGYIDSWNIHGGKRYVFDTSNLYHFECSGVNIDSDKSPTEMSSIKVGGACYWRFQLPLVWDNILRINVYHGTALLAPHLYVWTYKDSNNNIKEITSENLELLNNVGDFISLELKFNEPNIVFTHAEIVFAFQEAKRAQIPELQQGYEQEFLDWNVNLTVELPPDLDISEGDYLTESKYQKVWKVSALTKRVTAGGTIFGLSADLRALHSFEMSYSAMSLFTTEYFKGLKY